MGKKLAIHCDGAWKMVTICGRRDDGINVLDEMVRAEFYSEARLRQLLTDGFLRREQRTMVENPPEAFRSPLLEAELTRAVEMSGYLMECVHRGKNARASRADLEQIIADVSAEQQDDDPRVGARFRRSRSKWNTVTLTFAPLWLNTGCA